MLDGLLEDLLEAKWEAFAKKRSALLFEEKGHIFKGTNGINVHRIFRICPKCQIPLFMNGHSFIYPF
jgi:hypothetical protein